MPRKTTKRATEKAISPAGEYQTTAADVKAFHTAASALDGLAESGKRRVIRALETFSLPKHSPIDNLIPLLPVIMPMLDRYLTLINTPMGSPIPPPPAVPAPTDAEEWFASLSQAEKEMIQSVYVATGSTKNAP